MAAAAIDDTPERRLERQQPACTLQALGADAAYARSAAAARRTQGVRRLRAADRHCQSNEPWDSCRPTFADRAGDRRPDVADARLREAFHERRTLGIRSIRGHPAALGHSGLNPASSPWQPACLGETLRPEVRIDAAGRARTQQPYRCPL
ncbi:hypothetical protein [Lysobacter sp. Root983]|uniref:hypothetical protein n=1 Tax=Lysobacter sp. Root983 TaxID=1736613 RepID=UPI00070FA148|nr:hypothetical protein [Lysobacter sp. Root983]KRD80372.1 hypothetical protein ASE43_05825 [Lysobacter sp. Root983]